MMDNAGTAVSVKEERPPEDRSNGKVKILSWRGGKLSKIMHDFKTIGKEYGTPFKEIIVNKEPDAVGNRDKIINKTDSKSNSNISTERTLVRDNSDSSNNKSNGCINVTCNKQVIVIKTKSGKSVTIGPKPVKKVETNIVPEKQIPTSTLKFDDVNISEKKIFVTQSQKNEKNHTIIQNKKPVVNSSQDNKVFQYPGKVTTGSKILTQSPMKQETPVTTIIQHNIKETTSKRLPSFLKESLPIFSPNSIKKTQIKILPKPLVNLSSDVKKSAAFLVSQNSASKMKVDLVKTSDKNLLDNNKVVQNPTSVVPAIKVFANVSNSVATSSNKINVAHVSPDKKPVTVPTTPNVSVQKPINVKIATLPYQKADQAVIQNTSTKNIIPLTKPIAAVKMNCAVSPTIISGKKNGEIKSSPVLIKKHVELIPNNDNTKKPRRIPNLTIRTECMTFCPNEKISHDASTQTVKSVLRNTSVQTDLKEIQESEESPKVQELVNYLMDLNPMADLQQNNIPAPSKIIIDTREKDIISDFPPLDKTSHNKAKRDFMKLQLFTNLQCCVHFDNEGNLPIHKAVLENNLREIKKQHFFLKTRNEDVNVTSNYGQTPLHVAVINGICKGTINELIQFGASCNIFDPDGNSVLHLCVLHRDAEIMNFLVELCNKDTINATNDEGLTALMLACINKKQDLAEILLNHGADPNIQDGKSGRTAFFYAVENNTYDLAEFLVKNNADPKIKNYLGVAPLDGIKEPQLLTMTMLEDIRNSNKRSYLNDEDDPDDETYSPKEKKHSKKSKLSFITSYQKVPVKDFKEIPTKRRRRNNKRITSQE